ncbi:MAG: hypothetical protein HRU21_06205 [Pseudomonadales bacterium]|nr:hypothetical protein [Pseudomonadales bacterium]
MAKPAGKRLAGDLNKKLANLGMVKNVLMVKVMVDEYAKISFRPLRVNDVITA